MNKRTIIVTGEAGFFGSAVIRQHINDTENKIINLDALMYSSELELFSMVNK